MKGWWTAPGTATAEGVVWEKGRDRERQCDVGRKRKVSKHWRGGESAASLSMSSRGVWLELLIASVFGVVTC